MEPFEIAVATSLYVLVASPKCVDYDAALLYKRFIYKVSKARYTFKSIEFSDELQKQF